MILGEIKRKGKKKVEGVKLESGHGECDLNEGNNKTQLIADINMEIRNPGKTYEI